MVFIDCCLWFDQCMVEEGKFDEVEEWKMKFEEV